MKLQTATFYIVLGIMRSESRDEFSTAFAEWQAKPITGSEENAFLFHSSNSLTNIQKKIAPALIRFHTTAKVTAEPFAGWHNGMSQLLIREIDQLRGHLRRGRNQVSTRTLIEDATRLQRVWDAYRRLIDV